MTPTTIWIEVVKAGSEAVQQANHRTEMTVVGIREQIQGTFTRQNVSLKWGWVGVRRSHNGGYQAEVNRESR
jgi:hypothetical protein